MEALLEGTIEGLNLAAMNGARSCGIDTWAVDYAVIDKQGTQVGPVYAYRDGHHADGMKKVRDRVTWEQQYHLSGIQDMPINTIYQLLAEDPNRVDPRNRMLLVPDYLTFQLTGFIGTEVTNASTTSLVDPRTRDWAPELVMSVGIPSGFLPPIHEPGLLIGPCKAAHLEELSLISVATHDTASAFAGTPIADREQAIVISLGTWALVGFEALEVQPTPQAASINLTHELGVDGTVRCLRNVTGMWLFEECRRYWEAADKSPMDMDALLAKASSASEFLGIIDVDDPALASPGQTPTSIGQCVVGRNADDRAGLVRILFESLVARLAAQILEIERFSGFPRPILHVVGGASRIDFLMQWLADATGKEVVAGPVEAASLGNAAVQWCVLGEFSGITDARRAIACMPEIRRLVPEGDRDRWRQFAGLIGWEI